MDSIRTPLYYANQSVDWWGGLVAALLASALSYVVSALYADLQQQRKKKKASTSRTRAGSQESAAELPMDGESVDGNAGTCSVGNIRILVYLALCLLSFVPLEIVSLAVLPLTLIVPLIMMMFVWGTAFQCVISRDRKKYLHSKDFLLGALVVLLIAIAITSSPKGLYVLQVPSLVKWDNKSITYTAAFIVIAVALHLLRFSPRMATKLFAWTGLAQRDIDTVVRAMLTGILGGQALVLLKLVAEIIQDAIANEGLFEKQVTAIVCVVMVIAQGLHVFSQHYMISKLREENVRLMLPVHRMSMIISASLGAAFYLEEWLDQETTTTNVITYSLALSGLLAICLVYAYDAAHVVIPPAQKLPDTAVFQTPDIENRLSGSGQEMFLAASPRLWDLGAGYSSPIEDGSDEFYLANSWTTQRSSLSDGKATELVAHGLDYPEKYLKNKPLNFTYRAARNTMMTKRGEPNPHTSDVPDESRWEDPGQLSGQWLVRGKSYLSDGLKVDAGQTCMQVAGMQWSWCPNPVSCVSRESGGFVECEQAGQADRPFMFVVNFMVPTLGNYAVYFVQRPEFRDPVFNQMLSDFCNHESDQYRNDRFKLIPGVKEGSYFVRKAVGSKPALLCNKLCTTYYSSWNRESSRVDVTAGGGHWFEVSIDVGSSKVAKSIMGAVKTYASGLTLHLGYLIESKTTSELPERVLGGIDLYRPCMSPKEGVPLFLEISDVKNPTLRLSSIHDVSLMDEKGFLEQEGGYDTDGSSRSLMDDQDEFEKPEHFDGAHPSNNPIDKLDEQYPVPEGTMVVPKGHANPHADVGSSFWEDAGLQSGGWSVRGPTYSKDHIKIPCGVARMKIVAMDWHYSPVESVRHIAVQKGGFIEKFHKPFPNRPFLLIINFLVPSVGNYVTYLARNRDVVDSVFDRMLEDFINSPDDEFRNQRLKLIPGVKEGSYLVRKAVGSRPALLCQKLATRYFKGANYMEVDIDVGSSLIGAKIFAAVKGYASSLVLHLGVVLESKTTAELPEQLLFGIDIYTPVMSPRISP